MRSRRSGTLAQRVRPLGRRDKVQVENAVRDELAQALAKLGGPEARGVRACPCSARMTALARERLRARQTTKAAASTDETLRAFIPRVSPQYIAPGSPRTGPLALRADRRGREGPRVRLDSAAARPTETVLHALAWLLAAQRVAHHLRDVSAGSERRQELHGARHRTARRRRARSADRGTSACGARRGGGCLFTSVDGPATGQGAQVFVVTIRTRVAPKR